MAYSEDEFNSNFGFGGAPFPETDNEPAVLTVDPVYITEATTAITLNGKPYGSDEFIRREYTHTFHSPKTRDEVNSICTQTEESLRQDIIKTLTRDNTFAPQAARASSFAPVAPPVAAPAPWANTPAVFGAAPASGVFGANTTAAVANGGPVPQAGGLEWRSVPSKFGDGDLRFLTTRSQSSYDLTELILNEMQGMGLNRDAFTVWDNRTGDKGLEAGVPQGCVAAVKISKAAQNFVPADIYKVAIARVNYNPDGSINLYLTKEGALALKIGALDAIKLAQ